MRADKSYKGKVVASLTGKKGDAVWSQEFDVNNPDDWTNLGEIEYKSLQKQYAVAGYDNTNGEVIVKVVNGEDTPFSTEIHLTNAAKV